MLNRGSVLGGRYRLVDKLGEGGMGVVWVAENLTVEGAEVAVKVLHPSFAADPQTVQRFRNEARAAASINHPNIVKVHELGEAGEGMLFLVMERLRGESLAEHLESRGALPPREAVEVLVPVLEALDAAHAKDILHRDLKPENIFLSREGDRVVPRILDFGVSKFLGDDATRVKMTRTGALLGTPAYMSPEQARGATDIDLRSDVWAAGVILFELITGRLPFEGPNYNALLVQIATSMAPPIELFVPDLDPALREVVKHAMATDRAARYPTARALRDALAAWLRGESASLPGALRVTPASSAPAARIDFADTVSDSATTLARGSNTPSAGARAGRWSWFSLGLASAVVLAGGGFVAARGAPPPAAPSRAAVATPVARHALTVAGLPPGARVLVNDVLQRPPVPIAAGTTYRVQVLAPGYRDWMTVVENPTGDVAVAWRGEALAPPPTTTTPPPAPATVAARAPTRPARPSGAEARGNGRAEPAGAATRTPPHNPANLLATEPEF